MKLKELKNYRNQIFLYCANVKQRINRLDALQEDLAIDRYLDTQPGGGNCVTESCKHTKECEDKLSGLTSESVFGETYQKAELSERKLLDNLLDTCLENYEAEVYNELVLVNQMMEFLDCLCDLEFAEKCFSVEDIDLILQGGTYFLKHVKDSYDAEQEEFLLVPDATLAKEFLNEKGL